MSIYRLDLDALEESEKEHEQSAIKVNENIEDIYSVINEVNEDIYSGDDGDAFRSELADFVVKEVTPLQEKLTQIKTVLADGLSDAKSCKKLCNDFVITLGGDGNGKSEADMRGELYCDQSAINGLKEYCRSALSYSDSIRTICTSINDTLWELVIVKLYPTPYTSAIKEGCDKVDRLEDHSRELDAYATAAETIDSCFRESLNGCVFNDKSESESVLGARRLDEQEETIMRIMGQKGELSKEDKAILDEQLKIMEERGDIEGLQKVAEYAGNGENEAWTAGDAYVMAYIYNYAENNANAELATAVYDKMKKVDCINRNVDVHANSPHTIFEFEVKLDENKVNAILGELNPEKDGLAYYSLQRRSKYVQRVEKSEVGSNAEEPEVDFEITFNNENGKLVSVFTADGESMRLASVDMNEVVGQKWEDSPMKGMGFSKEERIALMSSIYTDEDISFIGGLARANTQSDYRDLFLQHEPDDLGDAAITSLYQYSFALANHNITCEDDFDIIDQDFSQLEKFVNGLLETDISAASDIEVYLNNLVEQGDLQLDITSWAISNNFENKDMVNRLIPAFEINAELYGLYACLLNLRENNVNYGFNNIGNCIQISELGFGLAESEEMDGKNVNIENITSSNFGFKEKVMYYDELKVLQQAPPVSDELERKIVLSSGNDRIKEKANKLIDLEKEKQKIIPKSVLKTGIAVASIYYPWIGVAAGIVESAASLEGDAARSTAKKALDNLNNQFLEGDKDVKSGITMLDGVADMVISYRKTDKERKETLDDIKMSMFGDSIIMEDSIVAEGVYSANTLLRRLELEKNGLSFLAAPEMKEAVKEELLNPSEASQSVLEKLTKEKSFDEDKVIPALYLVWTGEPYTDGNGQVSELDDISKLPGNDIRIYMDELDAIADNIGDEDGEIPYDKIDSAAFINHNFFEK